MCLKMISKIFPCITLSTVMFTIVNSTPENNVPHSNVLELTADGLQEVIDTNLLVFVIQICKTNTGSFEEAARISEQNGISDRLNIKFVKLTNKNDSRYCGWPSLNLYRYGRAIPYGSSYNSSLINLTQNSLTTNGILEWLEIYTQPAANILATEEDLQLFVKNAEWSILGYFLEDSKAKVIFWSVADELKRYAWGAVTDPSINPWDVDTIIINQDFGAEHLMLFENMTAENIETFVRMNAYPTPSPPKSTTTYSEATKSTLKISTTFAPIPKRAVQPGPQIVFIYDAPNFNGNEQQVDLSSGCIDLSDTWDQEIESIRTFRECVKLYELFGCESISWRDKLELRHSNMNTQMNLRKADFNRRIRSIQTCANSGHFLLKCSSHNIYLICLLIYAILPILLF